MSSFKSAIIMAVAALVVVVITIIAVMHGNVKERLIVSDVSGDVTITDTDGNTEKLPAGRLLTQGEIVTVNDGGACTIAYPAKDGVDENFVMMSSPSQLFVTDVFDGRGEDEIYLNRGAVMINGLNAKKCAVKVRTDSSSVLTNG
ncbi:MAG: hypothetical protein ILP19_07635, partial [Oscillospiraceae bacterium]|nr:hypothetical protein [Oscillospiraceae bacterium]